MKKIIFGLAIIALIGSIFLTNINITKAELIAEPEPVAPSDLWVAVRNLMQRLAILEQKFSALVARVTALEGSIGTTGGLHLRDGNNQDLGLLIERSATYLPTLGVVADFDFVEEKLIPEMVDLFYEQADCQGIPLISSEDVRHATSRQLQKIYRITADTRNNPPTYRVVRSATPKSRTYLSKTNFQGPTDPSPCISPGPRGPSFLIPVEEITLPFTEPLAKPLEIRED